MIEILHRTGFVAGLMLQSEVLIREQDYEALAMVNSDSLADAWNLSQNATRDWLKNEQVIPLIKRPESRSSTIGDVFRVNGELHIVLPEGYKLIAWGETVDMRPDFLKGRDKE